MEEGMRLKEAEGPVVVAAAAIPGSRLQNHNVSQRDRNRNQSPRNKLPDTPVLHSTQWANNYVTSSNTTTVKDLHQLTNIGSNFNNNISTTTLLQREHRISTGSEFLSECSPDDSLGDLEDTQQSSSSLDVSPQGDEYRCFSHEDLSDSDSLSDDGNCREVGLVSGRGIVNPNYPGFQHLAHQLHPSDSEEEAAVEETDSGNNNIYNNNNNNNNNNNGDDRLDEEDVVASKIDSVNHLDSIENFQKAFYDKPKFNIPVDPESECFCKDSSANLGVEKDLNIIPSDKETDIVPNEEIINQDVVDVGELEVKRECKPEEVVESENKVVVNIMAGITLTANITDSPDAQHMATNKLSDAFLSGAKDDLPLPEEATLRNKCDVILDTNVLCEPVSNDSNRALEKWEEEKKKKMPEKFSKEEETANEKEKEEDLVVPRKKEKMEINYSVKKSRTGLADKPSQAGPGAAGVRRRELGPRSRDMMLANRRSVPAAREKRSSTEILGGFDVYNIETAMPKIDLDAIESHLRAAREEERRRRNDREEIRRRLAMGSDADEYYGGERPGRKPSLQARLQSGMNLQICFMNETVSDTESPGSDSEVATSPIKLDVEKMAVVPRSSTVPVKILAATPPTTTRPSTSLLTLPLRREPEPMQPMTEADFFACQARLQAEARVALAQAKEMAHMQMEVERQQQKKSPITEMVRCSLEKVGILFPDDRRRVSRQILTEMNVAQLQVIVNDLHTQIEGLNEGLVKFLMDRDDLHMEQDSMLVDIEDLTRYLGAKEQTVKEQKDVRFLSQNNNHLLPTKQKINRIASLVKK